MDIKNIDIINTDALVIGGGIAGLLTAKLLVKNNKNVLLATDNYLCGGASYFSLKATLGIQTSDNTDKDKKLYREDIYNTAGDIIEHDIVETFVEGSYRSEEILKEIGFEPRLRNDKRPACFTKNYRPIYLISDWNKAKENLKNIFAQYKNLSVYENTKAIKILKGSDNKSIGALLIKENKYIIVFSKNVVIATGGIASLYKNNLYPNGVDGSGLILAKEAGARVRHIEFIQFIPGIITPKYKTLFGEHTLKYVDDVLDSNNNSIFSDYSRAEKKELFLNRSSYAPFSYDFPSREFDFRMAEAIINGSQGVRLLYNPAMYDDKENFLVTYLSWLKNTVNIDLREDSITIDHFAHSCNGGIAIDKNCTTDIKNLYAIGEVANTVEGVNRLGGNCIASICVFAPRLVKHILENSTNFEISAIEKNYAYNDLENYFESIDKNNISNNTVTDKEVLDTVSTTLTKYALVIRSENGLKDALYLLNKLQSNFSLLNNETNNSYNAYMSIKASMLLVQSCLNRKTSIGARYIKTS